MPHQTEPSVNNALGSLLDGMLSRSRVRSENTRAIANQPGLRPDILITATGAAPVVVEAEYIPASTVETEAKSRLGLKVSSSDRTIEAAIAVRYPSDLGDADDLQADLRDTRLSYCAFTEHSQGVTRFPESGWLEGSVEDLADLVRLMSVPQRAVDVAANALQEGIDGAASILDEMDEDRPSIASSIAQLLGMANVPQTRRMACAIVANALVFHERIAGMHQNVKPLRLVFGDTVPDPQSEVLTAWSDILDINYWAIFAIAKDIVEHLPASDAARVLTRLRDTAQAVNATGIDNAHDLTGRIFQRLIADRKYLATFYTLPASAALLAQLAVSKMKDVDWSDREKISKLRIADFACGTGALLSAVYEQIAARYERAGGNPADLHKSMMEEVLYGCDVMPSAIHITGSTLSGVEPGVRFSDSRLYTLAYGRQADGDVKIGSLELLQTSAAPSLFNTSDPALRTGSVGEETAAQVIAEIPDEGFDLVIMNPPFTRATNHEGAHADITNPAFAAFGATSADQKAMGKRINQMGRGTCYHGNAGLASAFAALADRKLKPGGVLAMVLPLSASAGLSWQRFRNMLTQDYAELRVLSIASNSRDMSFSSDTGIGECLVIAGKNPRRDADSESDRPLQRRVHFTSLRRRPRGFAEASAIAARIAQNGYIRRIEDGPYGGTDLMLGDEPSAQMLTAPIRNSGEIWGSVRMQDYALAQTAYALSKSELQLPAHPNAYTLKTAPLYEVSRLGLLDRDIIGEPARGPFTKVASSPTATYPALWSHNARRETRIVCEPDSQLLVRNTMESRAAEVWATAGRSHISRGFRFNSQPLSVAITEDITAGGRAWPNVRFEDDRFDFAFGIWGNSFLGLMCHWWHSNRQVAGRGDMTIRSAESLPVLDFRTLTDDQLAIAEGIFEEFRDRELKPAYLADADPNRALLDRRVIRDLLGFDEDIYVGIRRLAAKWCAEPSVHGGKRRPRGSDFVA